MKKLNYFLASILGFIPGFFIINTIGAGLNSYIFNQQINLYETSVIRASVIHPNCYAPEIATSTYIINHESGLPVISLTTNPENFFDNDYGIYMMGDLSLIHI